jgi:hypothetical protein
LARQVERTGEIILYNIGLFHAKAEERDYLIDLDVDAWVLMGLEEIKKLLIPQKTRKENYTVTSFRYFSFSFPDLIT